MINILVCTHQEINILVCTHQDGFIYHSEILRPIIVGAANLGEEADKLQLNLESSISKISIGGGALNNGDSTQVFRDDTGDNISHLNPYFCELTSNVLGVEKFRFCLLWVVSL